METRPVSRDPLCASITLETACILLTRIDRLKRTRNSLRRTTTTFSPLLTSSFGPRFVRRGKNRAKRENSRLIYGDVPRRTMFHQRTGFNSSRPESPFRPVLRSPPKPSPARGHDTRAPILGGTKTSRISPRRIVAFNRFDRCNNLAPRLLTRFNR